MITTVTTTTTAAAALSTASLALVAILTLIALLVQKEIVAGLSGPRAQRLARVLHVAIAPLLVVFVASVVVGVIDVLK